MKNIMTVILFAFVILIPISIYSSPSNRVAVLYFHRTKRCPTCLKMGSYSEEAVKLGFAEQLKLGTVEFKYIDFQDSSNSAIVEKFGITSPTLLVIKIVNNRMIRTNNLKDIWTKVRDKEAFIAYVQNNVSAYCE